MDIDTLKHAALVFYVNPSLQKTLLDEALEYIKINTIRREAIYFNNKAFKKSPNNYDDIPVYWCEECGSLSIKSYNDDDTANYCTKCHTTNIRQGTIQEWLHLHNINN